MCLTLTYPPEKFIAREDHLVYKIGTFNKQDQIFWPYYQHFFEYHVNKETEHIPIKAEFDPIDDLDKASIYAGYHSYVTKKDVYDWIFQDYKWGTNSHSRQKLDICLFVIPKGTVFYRNDEGTEYASEKIKLVGIHKPSLLDKVKFKYYNLVSWFIEK